MGKAGVMSRLDDPMGIQESGGSGIHGDSDRAFFDLSEYYINTAQEYLRSPGVVARIYTGEWFYWRQGASDAGAA